MSTAKHQPILTTEGARALLIVGVAVAAFALIAANWAAVASGLQALGTLALLALFIPGWALFFIGAIGLVAYSLYRCGGDAPGAHH